MSTSITVPVQLGARAYDVHVGTGLLERTGGLIAKVLGPRRVVIVADGGLEATPHLDRLRAGLDAPVLSVEPGESAKSPVRYAALMDELLALGPDRRTVIVACGGGVIGDLAGFAAATLLRGVPLVQVPTTLLAQVDSSVGGKTGINSRHGKNLIGAFHQPALVVADLDTLTTLPPRELRAGYAEVVKYGLLGDAAFFAWLEREGAQALEPVGQTGQARHIDARQRIVATSVAAKAGIVVADEEERTDTRALLNLGHTFAHAYEALMGYGDRLLHGEAVALGIVQAFRLSVRLGLCPALDAHRIEAHFRAQGLATEPAAVAKFDPDAMLATMVRDKKATDGRLALVLVRSIGDALVHRDVDMATLMDQLRACAPATMQEAP